MGITNQQPVKERGFWFIAFAMLISVTSSISAIVYFSMPEAIISVHPRATVGLLYFIGAMSVLSLVFAVLFWYWKKIGLYGFYVVLALNLIAKLYVGVAFAEILVGIAGGVIVALIVKDRLEDFT